MLKDNIRMLRRLHGLSQEEVAERVGVSRQAYAKWERGTTIPDVEKCGLLAKMYGTTVDSLLRDETTEGIGTIPPPPAGKSIWGSVTINERGQIVIPKGARDRYCLAAGMRLIVLGDEIGIALIPAEFFEKQMKAVMEMAAVTGEPV